MPSQQLKKSLEESTARYHSQIFGSPGEEYLANRGITREAVIAFRLGYVGTGSSESRSDREFTRRISIPYLSAGGVVSLRYRSTRDEDTPKYLGLPGIAARPFNTPALLASDPIYLCEGEIDAISLWVAGLPAVAIPGATSWKKEWSRIFRMRSTVLLLDDDEAGKRMGKQVSQSIERCRIINMGVDDTGKRWDANSYLVAHGAEALREYVTT